MSSWRNILPSRHNKNTCRHGEIYYLDKWTSQKIMSSWRDILSCQVDFPKIISRHGDYIMSSWRNILYYQVDITKYMSSWRDILSYQVDFFRYWGGGGGEGKTPKCTDKLYQRTDLCTFSLMQDAFHNITIYWCVTCVGSFWYI